MKLFGSMKVIDNELTIGGIKCTDLAEQYGLLCMFMMRILLGILAEDI